LPKRGTRQALNMGETNRPDDLCLINWQDDQLSIGLAVVSLENDVWIEMSHSVIGGHVMAVGKDTFLGVVERNGSIYIPWRGTHVATDSEYEPGQNLLVTIVDGRATIDLPTIVQLKQIRDELNADWERFTEIFRQVPMGRKVRMLQALDQSQKEAE
jgi:hypothetical protein